MQIPKAQAPIIPKELFAEKNYEGSRLILIEDEKLNQLQIKLSGYQAEINPVLEKLSAELYPAIDPIYQEMNILQEQIKEKKEKIRIINEGYKADMELIEQTEQKAQLIKDKMQPIIIKAVEGQLGEFEEAKNTVVKDGKIYAEVFDKIEETVKAIRARNTKK